MIDDSGRQTSDDLSPYPHRADTWLDRLAHWIGRKTSPEVDLAADLNCVTDEGIVFLEENAPSWFSWSRFIGPVGGIRWAPIKGSLVMTKERVQFVAVKEMSRVRLVDVLFADPEMARVKVSMNSRGRLILSVPRNVGTSYWKYSRFNRKARIETPRAREALGILSIILDQARQQEPTVEQTPHVDGS